MKLMQFFLLAPKTVDKLKLIAYNQSVNRFDNRKFAPPFAVIRMVGIPEEGPASTQTYLN